MLFILFSILTIAVFIIYVNIVYYSKQHIKLRADKEIDISNVTFNYRNIF